MLVEGKVTFPGPYNYLWFQKEVPFTLLHPSVIQVSNPSIGGCNDSKVGALRKPPGWHAIPKVRVFTAVFRISRYVLRDVMSPPMYPIYKYLEFPSQQRRSQNFNQTNPTCHVLITKGAPFTVKPLFCCAQIKNLGITPRKINIEPENDGLESMIFLVQGARILRFHADFPGCNLLSWCR